MPRYTQIDAFRPQNQRERSFANGPRRIRGMPLSATAYSRRSADRHAESRARQTKSRIACVERFCKLNTPTKIAKTGIPKQMTRATDSRANSTNRPKTGIPKQRTRATDPEANLTDRLETGIPEQKTRATDPGANLTGRSDFQRVVPCGIRLENLSRIAQKNRADP